MRYEAVIGLEVHAQLLTRTKAFCGCSTTFGAPPNTHVCPVCLGLPGALPVLNGEAVRLAVRTALALSCAIRPTSRFARKNYFYPDLPEGLPDQPVRRAVQRAAGTSTSRSDGADQRRIGITRVHMEEDAGKSVHHARATRRRPQPLGRPARRDRGRARPAQRRRGGRVPARAARRARLHRRQRRQPRGGELPLRRQREHPARGRDELGTRVELKNINSFRFVEKAIAHEIARQEAVLERRRARRAGDARLGRGDGARRTAFAARRRRRTTGTSRTPTCRRSSSTTLRRRRSRASMPELPRAKRERFVREMGLTPVRGGGAHGAPARRRVLRGGGDALTATRRSVANFVQSEVLRDVTTHGSTRRIPVTRARRSPGCCGSSTAGRSAASRPRRSTRRSRGPSATPGRRRGASSGCSR